MKKAMVSGCFDLLHAGHIQFLKEASEYGGLTVCLGSDKNLHLLKDGPMFSEKERQFILSNIKFVSDVLISTGTGLLDFEPELKKYKPDFFIVNEDGHNETKKQLCQETGVEYIVLKRIPAEGLQARSSSGIKAELNNSTAKKELRFPYRLCMTGGWMDQPWVSKIAPGAVVVVGLEPTMAYNEYSGMATSTRKTAMSIWSERLPSGDPEKLSRILFGAENPPDCEYVSGSQDAIGLVYPGINKLYYDGGYWPEKIDSCRDEEAIDWLESVVNLVPLNPRKEDYSPLNVQNLEKTWIEKLGESGINCYDAIVNQNVELLGKSLSDTMESWRHILPDTVPEYMNDTIDKYKDFPGSCLSGAGGGYLVVISDKPVDNALKICVRK